MTHEYTLLVGATVLPGGGRPPCTALAWAAGTILALGSDAEVRAVSRGDSQVIALPGRFVIPFDAPLEVGARADIVVLATDPRISASDHGSDAGDPRGALRTPVAVFRGGHVVEGSVESRRD